MAFPTSVNSQITDSVTQANVHVLADAPAQAMASLYQVVSHSVGMSMQNAVAHQQAMNQLSQAALASAISQIMRQASNA